jgi:predicted permease
MKSARRFLTRVFNSATRRTHDQRIREEIEEHIALQTEENLRAGLSSAEARRQAILKFGAVEVIDQNYRAERGLLWIENLLQDVRISLRVLRKSPGFTLVAVLTLALAIGANAVVFSVLNAFILRPLNLPEEERLYQLFSGKDKSGEQSFPDYLDLRDRNRSFDELMAGGGAVAGLDTGDGNPSSAWVILVTGNYFDGLRLQTHLGRLFHVSDEHGTNSAPYIVLTHAYWHSHFHDDPGVVGRVVQVNKNPFTIVGVAPPEFHGTLVFFSPDFFVPMVNREQVEGKNEFNERGKRWVFSVIGHLKAGITPAQAIADLNSVGAALEKSYPKDDQDMTFSLGRPGLYGDYLGRPIRAFLTGLMLLTGLILLAACTNLGTLFAARAADRSREVSLRLALGSTRGRILRQLFTEATLISLMGGAVGIAGSVALLRALSAWRPFSRYPLHMPVNPDANVYGLALLLALVSGFIFGAVPVRQILRTNPYEVIKAGSSGRAGRRLTFRDVLLVAQIAICGVLVTSSLVAVRGMVRSLHSNFGFEPQNAVLADTDLLMGGYHGDQMPAMQRRMLDAVEAIPGVESAGLVDPVPLYAGSVYGLVFLDRTADLNPVNAAADAFLYKVSPQYFHAAGTALLSGRSFTWHDDKDAPRVAVVNAEFAREIFGSVAGAVGGHYKLQDGTRIEVVGIAEQGKYRYLTEDPKPAMFLPLSQSPSSETWMVVRSTQVYSNQVYSKQRYSNQGYSKDFSQQLGPAIRNTLRDLDSGLPVYIQTWPKELEHSLFAPRMATYSLAVLGVIAAMLCITGIFGTAAYTVSKRLKELGIRVALGAQRREVLQAALGRPFKMLALGSAAGLLLGILASRVLAFIVSQATPHDPLVLAGVVLAMSLLGLLATWIPARHALKVDPLILLREE